MNIEEVEDAIYDLEDSFISYENATELASLYIIRDNLLKMENRPVVTEITEEIQDILPAYKKYCDIKCKYQRHEITEDGVVEQLKAVCEEILDLFNTLYSGTDMVKERRQLRQVVEQLHKKYSK